MANERDTLGVDLEIGNQAAVNNAIDQFYNKLVSTNAAINSLGANSNFASDFGAKLNDVQNRAAAVQRSFQSFARFDTKGIDGITQSAIRLQKEALTVSKRISDIKAIDLSGKSESFLKILADDAATAERRLQSLERASQRISNRRPSAISTNQTGANLASGITDGFGIPTSAAAAGAGIGAAVTVFAVQAEKAAKEAAAANLRLRSTAIETGIEYTNLSEKAKEFGRINILSNRAAESTFAQIANFANAAGRGEKLDEFRKRLSDLAAAKGIDPTNLGEIAKQLNALTDEATDKLLNANPSAFYEKFAIGLKKTADQLTDAEKRAAVFDAVLQRGIIFDGTAEKRLNDASSATDRLSKSWENLKESIGAAILPVVDFIAKSGQIDKTLFRSDAETQEIQRNNLNASIRRATLDAQKLRETDAQIRAAQSNPLGSFENFSLSKVDLSKTFFDAAARQKAIDQSKQDAQLFVTELTKRIQSGLSNNKDLGILRLIQREFQSSQNLIDPGTRIRLQNEISGAISNAAAQGFQKILSDPNATVAKLKQALSNVTKSGDLLSETRENLVREFEQTIKRNVTEATAKVREQQSNISGFFNNLFLNQTDNIFVKVFSDADKAIQSTRRETALLSDEMKNAALVMTQQQNGLNLFNARIDARLSAFDLNEQANSFRASFQRPNISIQDAANFISKRTGTTFDDLNRDSLISSLARQSIQSDPNLSLQQRLQKQIDIVQNLNPTNESERQAADRRIIALTSGFRPDQLNATLRDFAASARENEATRLINAERNALNLEKERTETIKKVNSNLEKLLEIAQSEGLTGVIRIINEAKESVEVETTKRINSNLTKKLMN